MTSNRRLFVQSIAGATALALTRGPVWAQGGWPSKPVKVLVGYPGGGLIDALARGYGDFLSQKLGQPFLVENKPGAGGMLAGAEAAKAAPDGHTLWLTLVSSMNQNRVYFKKMPYDPDKDFVHVSGFPVGHLAFAVNASSPIQSVKDLVEHGRKQRVTIGNFSPGTHPHMLAQQLNIAYGVQAEPVPYRGDGPMWIDLASGQITAAMGGLVGINPHVQSGKLRVIAMLSSTRSPVMPDVPTFEEQGFKEPVFTLSGWVGLFAPAGTPREVVQRVSALVQEAADAPRMATFHRSYAMDRPWTASEFEKIDRETKGTWIALAKSLNLSLD